MKLTENGFPCYRFQRVLLELFWKKGALDEDLDCKIRYLVVAYTRIHPFYFHNFRNFFSGLILWFQNSDQWIYHLIQFVLSLNRRVCQDLFCKQKETGVHIQEI